MDDKTYDKSAWRARNIAFVKSHMSRVGPFLWIEPYGRSGGESLQSVISSGVIPSPDHFYGIDNDAQVIVDHYASGGTPVDMPGSRLCYGDIYVKTKDLAENNPTPIGVLNLDLIHGPELVWGEDSTQLLVEAMQHTLRKARKCVFLMNCAADTRYMGGDKIPERVRQQHGKLSQFKERLLSVGLKLHLPSIPVGISSSPLNKGEYRTLYPDNKLAMEVYVAENRHIPMLTTRLIITEN